jgi:hypothetical protein
MILLFREKPTNMKTYFCSAQEAFRKWGRGFQISSSGI